MQFNKKNIIFISLITLSLKSFSSEFYISHLLSNPSFKPGACGHIYLSAQGKQKIILLKNYQYYKHEQKELMKLFPLTSNDLFTTNYKLAQIVKMTMENDGFTIGEIIKIKSKTDAGGQTVATTDFYVPIISPPENSDFRKIFDRLKETNPNLKFYYIVDAAGRANGAYSDYRTTIFLNPDHIYLDHGDITNTPLHEITHSHRYKLIEQGQTSLLNASISSSGTTAVTSVPGYTNYMNFQELATFTKDYHQLKTGKVQNINVLSGEVDPLSRKITLEEVVQLKKTRAVTISRNIQKIILNQQEILDTVPNLINKKQALTNSEANSVSLQTLNHELDKIFVLQTDPLSNNNWMIKFPYSDNGQTIGEFQVWLPDLRLRNDALANNQASDLTSLSVNKMQASELTVEELQQVLSLVQNQLRSIKKEAIDYEHSLLD